MKCNLARREFSIGAASMVLTASVAAETSVISDATARNWERLGNSQSNRLTSRANKRMSKKRIIPIEYFSKSENVAFAQRIIDYADAFDLGIKPIIKSLAISVLEREGLSRNANVRRILREVKDWGVADLSSCGSFSDGEQDLLGGVYQSLLFEGERNEGGVYYTRHEVAVSLTSVCKKENEKSLLDPCCGSGSVLCSAYGIRPENIYGIDRDSIAVFIAKINLIRKYPDVDFDPKIVCADYLSLNKDSLRALLGRDRFENVCTNPPWGAVSSEQACEIPFITSREVFSLFYVKSFSLLTEEGVLSFLLPQSVMNVAIHRDLRDFMLSHGFLKSIMQFDKLFSGVTTKYVRIVAENKKSTLENRIIYEDFEDGKIGETPVGEIIKRPDLSLLFIGATDIDILGKMQMHGKHSLSNSLWALGVVTGDNKGKLNDLRLPNTEPIYTGKEVQRYKLSDPQKFISFDRSIMQQAARDEFYRANEKLVYRFITDRPIFAYDNTRSLTLNSANILIPKVPGWSVKAMAGLLNSDAVIFFYKRTYGGTKVLKSHLCSMPIPEISQSQHRQILNLVDDAISGDTSAHAKLQRVINELYSLSETEANQIKESIYGKAD